MKTFPAVLALLLATTLAQAAPPVVSNIRAAQRAGTKLVDVYYDVADADGDALAIGVEVSGDGGLTYTIPAAALSGHVGAGIAPGANRFIVWNAGLDWNGQYVANTKIRVTAHDGSTPLPPSGMVYIQAGVFQMGDNLDGATDALPLHNVTLNAFFMDRTEVAKEHWQAVQTWAVANGYSISGGSFKAPGHPVQAIPWYDMVKWCNARSQKEGLTPCYYTDDAQTVVYRSGNSDVTNARVKWSANGYRLPTEAEWEKAARGGSMGLRFPWGNTVNGSQANYAGSGDAHETGSSAYTTPVGHYNGSQLPAGVDMANGYGLYDMGGNVVEWCWDWYGGGYYGDATANSNPHGPISGFNRVLRGGSWIYNSIDLRCAWRNQDSPGSTQAYFGFRCVRGL